MAAKRSFPLGLLLLVLALLAGGGLLALSLLTEGGPGGTPPLHEVRRGPLKVTVLESGSLEALASTTISSEVEGSVAIVSLVEEGVILTPQDVAQGRVLVKLDTSDLEEKLARQLIDVQSAQAAAVNAVTSLEIQQKEDASKERQAVLKVEFARLDLRRSVGVAIAGRLEALRARVDAGDAPLADLEAAIRAVLEDPGLQGEMLQKLRLQRSEISLADEELKRALVKWDWSKKLLAKDFVSRDEEDADRLAVERRRIEKERAETAFTQLSTYDAPKEVTKLLSDLVEAEGELTRVKDRARAAQERAASEVRAKKEQESLQQMRYEKYVAQLKACVIRASVPGLVLYASSNADRWGDDSSRIKEGASVRERQPILTIPDTAQMGARVNIHESVVDRVKVGQSVTVTVESATDRPLKGVVEKVKDLPNASDRWMNPDLKLYATTIRLQDAPPGLKPGMTVKAEILIEQLADVLSVPVQAVAGPAGRPWVHVWRDGRSEERRIEIGSTNDRFVVVLDGLTAGEQVLLAPPRSAPEARGGAAGRGGRGGEGGPAGPGAAREAPADAGAGTGAGAGGAGAGGRSRPPRDGAREGAPKAPEPAPR